MTITLTPELERALMERAERQGTTPELLALHDLNTLYVNSTASNQVGGKLLTDFLAGRTERTDSRMRNGGQSSRLSEDEDSFSEYLEEKRRQGHL